MAKHVVHVSEAEATSNFADVLARVRAGAEVLIEIGNLPVAVVRSAGDEFRPRPLSESIALAKKHEEETGAAPVLDPDFASDMEEVIKNREVWNPPAWE
jgi:antitoxin (DNA-binding transcriptional repressor) of toxin-antitoxin stability system